VFGAWFGHRYADNSRYVFEFVVEHERQIRAVWLTRDPQIVAQLQRRGREVHLTGSWQGFWLACRAGLAVVTCGNTDVNPMALSRSRRLQLWHGTPLKRILADDHITEARPRPGWARLLNRFSEILFPFVREQWDLIISPSPAISPRLASAFSVSFESLAVTGYPRGDVILRSPPEPLPYLEPLKERFPRHRLLLYAPTHRLEGRGTVDLFADLERGELTRFLETEQALLLVRMHYYHAGQSRSPKTTELGQVCWLSDEDVPDINFLLPHIDILITDYSSIYFDYLLLDRPVVFAPFDLEDYVRQDRDLYDPYEGITPGPKCRTWHEVFAATAEFLHGSDRYRSARHAVRQRFNAFVDTENCRRVVQAAKRLLDKA